MPAGLIAVAPTGTIACLRLASRRASGSKFMRLANSARIVGDLLLHLLVQDELAAGEAADDLRGQVVRGRAQAAAGDDEVHSLVAP